MKIKPHSKQNSKGDVWPSEVGTANVFFFCECDHCPPLLPFSDTPAQPPHTPHPHLFWAGVWPGAGSGCWECLRPRGAGCRRTGLRGEPSGPGVCGGAKEQTGSLFRELHSRLSGGRNKGFIITHKRI